jgi:hypothetical protein
MGTELWSGGKDADMTRTTKRTCGHNNDRFRLRHQTCTYFSLGNISLLEVTSVHIALSHILVAHSLPFLVILASTHGEGVVQLMKHNILFLYHPVPSEAAALMRPVHERRAY